MYLSIPKLKIALKIEGQKTIDVNGTGETDTAAFMSH